MRGGKSVVMILAAAALAVAAIVIQVRADRQTTDAVQPAAIQPTTGSSCCSGAATAESTAGVTTASQSKPACSGCPFSMMADTARSMFSSESGDSYCGEKSCPVEPESKSTTPVIASDGVMDGDESGG